MVASSQTLSPIDHIPEPNAAKAIDQLGIVMTTAGIASTGVISSPGATSGANAAAGVVGEVVAAQLFNSTTTATVTITIAAPGVITWTAHGFSAILPQPVVFTTTIALPTGITSGTVYYTVPSSVTTNTFTIATSVANALAGTQITTTGSQSGTQTGTAGVSMANTTAIDLTGYTFTAGDWDVWAAVYWNLGTTTTWTKLETSLSQTAATLATPTAVVGSSYGLQAQISAAATNGTTSAVINTMQLNISTPTTVWLVVKGAFAISTCNAGAAFMARRQR